MRPRKRILSPSEMMSGTSCPMFDVPFSLKNRGLHTPISERNKRTANVTATISSFRSDKGFQLVQMTDVLV